MGRKILNTNRRILIPLNDYGDKVDLLTCANNSPYNFENFVVTYENVIEKVHTSFMKRTLNISEHASNKILDGEFARFPLLHNIWAFGVKYWLHLCNGTKNVLFKQCFQLNLEENHNWLQSIQYLFCSYGFGNIF